LYGITIAATRAARNRRTISKNLKIMTPVQRFHCNEKDYLGGAIKKKIYQQILIDCCK
jgi:hypothetical protein